MEARDAALQRRIEAEFTVARNVDTGRTVFACPDDLWQTARAAHYRNSDEIPEPFPEGHVIFEGKCRKWEIVRGQTVLPLVEGLA